MRCKSVDREERRSFNNSGKYEDFNIMESDLENEEMESINMRLSGLIGGVLDKNEFNLDAPS